MSVLNSRSWCFTINNYTEDDYSRCFDMKHQYVIVGKEKGEEGTEHLQGYVYFTNARTFKSMKKKLPRAHIEMAKGNCLQNVKYCSKGGDFKDDGKMPEIQGSRTDIELVKDVLNKTGSVRKVAETVSSYQALKFAETYIKYVEPKRVEKPNVYWFYGTTGTGKSKTAYELFPDAYTCMSTAKWFEGYDAHSDVIIDDMRRDFCKFHELLRMLDRYPMRIETKGGSRQFLAKNIVITSAYHPTELYNTREDIQQLLRRIDEIRDFDAMEL